jgi:ABC-type multidrug transport system ATPase subunit
MADETGAVMPGGIESIISFFMPWAATLYLVMGGYLLPKLAGVGKDFGLWLVVFLVIIVAICHGGRRTAVALSRGLIKERPTDIRFRRIRGIWRSIARKLLGFGLRREEVRALTGVQFRTTRGMIGILGPNGAGKTTLLRMLAGILDPTAGTIWLGNVRLGKLRKYLARWVGYLPQDFGLPQDMTARGYLQYYAMLYDLPEEKRDERVNRLLEDVGLMEKADQPIGSYSGGQRQRVAVARTLLRLPPVIIVDEPTVGLDPRERIRFRNLLSRLAAGRVVLFSTHVVEDVAVACERVIVITRGRMVYDGEPMALAETAVGRVWEVRLPAEEEGTLPDGVLVVDQVPEAGGISRSRVLSRTKPHDAAVPIEPSLEDGYLWLVGDGLAEGSA